MPRFKMSPFSHRLTVCVCLFVGSQFLVATSASAQDAEPGAFSKMAQTLNPANWKMPSMPKAPSFRMPSFLVPDDDQNRIVERKDGLMTDVKNTASASWQRTKETFNPARLNPMNMFAGAGTQSTATEKSDSPGFFSSMFGAPKAETGPEERVANVNDFLGQQRP
ncbi:hypothetical protein [Rhodopirellula sp. P2]|uniref:hypothetical protein n=1 Tax=Rhodopirellula sp. P2 TaxID=2127060 RepID=UPI002367EDF8|nr:hypothetical protein [Rhodopirellula sp. P2]WDQ16028.1 hypothetical protein PSR62_20690 [Rhodopirellula sp. P2]